MRDSRAAQHQLTWAVAARGGTGQTTARGGSARHRVAQWALEHVRELQRRYDDLVPVRALADGFRFRGRRVSFGSFYSGIFRPKERDGPAALCLVTAPPKTGRPAPYDNEFDEATDRFTYRFRAAKTPTPPCGRRQLWPGRCSRGRRPADPLPRDRYPASTRASVRRRRSLVETSRRSDRDTTPRRRLTTLATTRCVRPPRQRDACCRRSSPAPASVDQSRQSGTGRYIASSSEIGIRDLERIAPSGPIVRT